MTSLPTLKARLEEASEPDRELDAQIWAAMNGGYIESNGMAGRHERDVIWHQDNGLRKAEISGHVYRDRTLLCDARDCPKLTASVDAALELVERKLPGAEFEIGTTYGPARVTLGVNINEGPYCAERLDGNIPLAILTALISALIDGESE